MKKRGFITVMNHNSVFDDPLLITVLIPVRWYWRPEKIRLGGVLLLVCSCRRYCLCAENLCFKNIFRGEYFRLVKSIPINTKGGIYHKMLDIAIQKISEGNWYGIVF